MPPGCLSRIATMIAGATAVVLGACASNTTTRARTDEPPLAPALELNQLQMIGTHNSYKLSIEPALYERMLAFDKGLASLDYAHLPLSDQLNLGVRNLELDVCNDPVGGMYAHPLGQKLLAAAGITPEPWDGASAMASPGFKVMHEPDFDFRANQPDFALCMEELRAWSNAHPGHLPVVVTMNLKDDRGRVPGGVQPAAFDAASLDRLDLDVLEHLGADHLITPDRIRGDAPSVHEALLRHGWPTVDACRGRFLFVLDETGEKRAAYIRGHEGLRGRVYFTDSPPDTPESAVMVINDPIESGTRIREMVAQGYLVRTRADADTQEARRGDLTRFRAAMDSGAQVITTDYPIPDRRIHPTYRVRFSNNQFVRPNPVTSPTSPVPGASSAGVPNR